MSGVGITYLWTRRTFPPFIRLEGKRGDYEVYVPERTCRNVNKGHSFTCSKCGDCTFNPFPEVMPLLKLNYCPNCGARVVEK